MATKKSAAKRRTKPTARKATTKRAAKKKTARKSATKKTTAKKTTSATAYKVTAKRGQAQKGVVYQPGVVSPAAAPAQIELMEPRPKTTSRYPISNEAFEKIKAAATEKKLRRTTAVQARDANRKVLSAELASSPAAPGNEPASTLTPSANFAGIGATGWLPPDCTMAVGPDHVLLAVNSTVAIYTKAGAQLLKQTLTQWFANVVQGMTIFDPKALFDQHAGRWVLMAVAVNNSAKTSVHLLSISRSADPGGGWLNYKFDAKLNGATATNNWADFPALGVDSHALYITSNMFAFGGGFAYAKIRVIPKAGPYAGLTAPYFDFIGMKNADDSVAFTIQPCHTFGAPHAEYLVNTGFPSGDYLTIWTITNTGATPTLARKQVPVSAYNLAPNADQPGGGTLLNTGDVRVMHAVFRGDSIWTSFTAAHNWGAGPNRAAVQWCQIRAAAPAVVQQGVFGAGDAHYFYPAICPDNNGNVTMVFSRSGPNEFGTIGYTGRRATDPLGTMQGSTVLKAGVAKYVALDGGGRNRWGDYNGVASDPANSRVVWMYSEYASAPNVWGSWVGSAFF